MPRKKESASTWKKKYLDLKKEYDDYQVEKFKELGELEKEIGVINKVLERISLRQEKMVKKLGLERENPPSAKSH